MWGGLGAPARFHEPDPVTGVPPGVGGCCGRDDEPIEDDITTRGWPRECCWVFWIEDTVLSNESGEPKKTLLAIRL